MGGCPYLKEHRWWTVVTALFFRVGVFLAALLAAMAGALPVFVLGLFVPGYTVLPLTILLAGLFSALGAAWMANLLHPDRSTSDLLPIVGFTESAAALLVVAMFALTFGLMVVWPFPAFPLLFVVLTSPWPAPSPPGGTGKPKGRWEGRLADPGDGRRGVADRGRGRVRHLLPDALHPVTLPPVVL